MGSNHNIKDKLQALRDAYSKQLPAQLDELENLWQTLISAGWDRERAASMHRLAHSLAGSGSIFGYPQLSRDALALEQQLNRQLEQDAPADAAQRAEAERLLAQLRAAAQAENRVPLQVPDTGSEAQQRHPDTLQPLVYLLEDDKATAQELALQLTHFGYRVEVFRDGEGLREAVAQQRPAAFIVDIVLPEGRDAGLELMSELRAREKLDQPLIFISSRDDFQARLAAVRAGGDAYFVKPVATAPLIDSIDRLTHSVDSEPYRILIVDDDATLAAHYALVLEKAGMQLQTVTEAKAMLKALLDFHPELILMDVYMPECSGPELAQIVRQQEAFEGIPIIFLSTETSAEKQLRALHLGGDEFLVKPIDNDYLASFVSVRAERARFLSTLMLKDSLTGLLNHTRIKEQLSLEVSRAQRSDSSLAFAMIDIDHFKSVNDRFGHMMGDHVIKTLARLFQQRLRKSDSIGRYGGEEFAVILPVCDAQLAEEILDAIRALFAEIRFMHDGQNFSVSFSAGIATWPQYKDSGALNRAADEALYQAKRAGRNRIVIAGARA